MNTGNNFRTVKSFRVAKGGRRKSAKKSVNELIRGNGKSFGSSIRTLLIVAGEGRSFFYSLVREVRKVLNIVHKSFVGLLIRAGNNSPQRTI